MVWEDVGRRIKSVRIDSKLTQKQFGKIIGKSEQYVGRVERGQKISLESLAIICKKTNVTMDFIAFGVIDPIKDMELLSNFSDVQFEICLEMVKKVTEMLKTPGGNKLILRELARRQLKSKVI